MPIEDIFNLRGKKISSLDSIITDRIRNYNVVFLFNYYDCSSCIDLGFTLTKKIDSLYNLKKVTIVSIMGSPSSYQRRNAYYEYIYSDSKDLIRKEGSSLTIRCKLAHKLHVPFKKGGNYDV